MTINEVAADLQKLRILIVDDNYETVTMMAAHLRLDGYDVRTASGGERAEAIARDFQPEVAVLDIWLPSSSGYELAEWIRHTSWGRGTLLIAVTGWGHEQARRRSEQAGFDYHLVKPVDFSELRRLVKSYKNAR